MLHEPDYMTNGSGVIAVTEQIDQAGAIIWWSLSGTVEAGPLAQAWGAAQLDPGWLIELPTPEQALRRAMKEQREKHRLIRSLGDRRWAVVDEQIIADRTEAGAALEYSTTLRVWLTTVGSVKCSHSNTRSREIEDAFERALNELSNRDVGSWLAILMRKLGGVRLRDTGGIYFIPRDTLPRWHAIASAVRGAGSHHRLSEVPALRSEEAVDAILGSLRDEAEAEAKALETDLMDGLLGERALDTRIEQVDAIRKKVDGYGRLLGRNMVDLQEQLESLRMMVAAAAMAARAKAAEAA